jgi:hypothetical protein
MTDRLIPRSVSTQEEATSRALSTVLSPQELQAKDAFEHELRIKERWHHIKTEWLELARDLYEFLRDEKWRILGAFSQEEWLAQPDLDLNWRTVYHHVQVYREYVVNRQIEPARVADIPVGRLREVIPALKQGHTTTEEALADATVLSRADLRRKYRDQMGHAHDLLDADKEPDFYMCSACGSRVWKKKRP